MMRTTRAFRTALALLLLWGVFPAAAQHARPYKSLAVMDLELDRASRSEMEQIVDQLTRRLRETRSLRRVVGREERERLLSRQSQVPRSRDYQEDQISRAARLRVELAVLGRLSWNGQQYGLQVWLLEVESGEVLFEKGGFFRSRQEVQAACDRLAVGIAGMAASPPPAKTAREPQPPLALDFGFGMGMEGVSVGPGVAGGSYLYVESLALLNSVVGIDARYAFRMFPAVWGSHLLSTHLRVHVHPKKEEVLIAGSLGYLLGIDARGRLSHFIGARLVPIAGGEDEFLFELLPMGLYLDVETWEAVFALELLSIRFLTRKR